MATDSVVVRRFEASDIAEASVVSAAAFEFDISEPATAMRWRERLEHLLATDPDGGFVADARGRVVAVAQAMVREGLWCLSLLTSLPAAQSTGAGRAVLERALGYGSRNGPGLIVSSNDPRALRLYALAGFWPRATFQAEGAVDRRRLPRVGAGVREAGEADLDELAPISRELRGAAHTSELQFVLRRGGRILRLGARGFVVSQPGHSVWLLAARDEQAATALLWSALELAGPSEEPPVRWITSEQRWAIDVLLRARLRLSAYGALAVRGDPGPLCPYVPSPPFA